MKLWDLPGPKRFIESIRGMIGEGSSVVARFPGSVPAGFEDALITSLGNMLVATTMETSDTPMEDVCRRFMPDRNLRTCTASDICMEQRFQGRLISLQGMSRANWSAWRDFLKQYSQASRSTSIIGRTLFLVPLTGLPPESSPENDVALNTVEWDGLTDQIDLMLFANENLRHKISDDVKRLLLVMTVTKVASWDFDSAVYLLSQDIRTILSPVESLRALAKRKGWTVETPPSWGYGTASKAGIAHPAYAAIEEPPREIDRRLWSAQASTLLPWIETQRYETIECNLFEVRGMLKNREDDQNDPFGLELGELHTLFSMRGASRDTRKRIRNLRRARNALAHLTPLAAEEALRLIANS